MIDNLNLTAPCNIQCHCNTEFIQQVCMNDQTYFSPCHAGCTGSKEIREDGQIEYTDCACGGGLTAIEGECEKGESWEEDCGKELNWMLGLTFFTVFFEFLTDTTVPIAILRYVKPNVLTCI